MKVELQHIEYSSSERYTRTRADNKIGYRQPKMWRVNTLNTPSVRFGRYSTHTRMAESHFHWQPILSGWI